MDAGGVAVAGAAKAEAGDAGAIFKSVFEESDIEVVICGRGTASHHELLLENGRLVGKAEFGSKVMRRGSPEVIAHLQGKAAKLMARRSEHRIVDLKPLVAQRGEIFPAHTQIEREIGQYFPVVLEVGGDIF